LDLYGRFRFFTRLGHLGLSGSGFCLDNVDWADIHQIGA
jgi:hypothetical protein